MRDQSPPRPSDLWYNIQMPDDPKTEATSEQIHEPVPVTPPPPERDIQGIREEELRRAAKFSKQRQEHEKEVKQKVLERRQKDAALARSAQQKLDQKKVAFEVQKKEYGVITKKREKEILEFKKKHEAEQKLFDDQKKARDEKRKKEEGYMRELNEVSRLKILEQHRVNKLKADLVRAEQKVQFDFRTSMDAAERDEVQTKARVDRDTRDRKSILESEARTKHYQLEAVHRSRLLALDTELRNHVSSLLMHSPLEAERGKSQIEAQFRTKKRKLEADYQEKKHEIEANLSHAKLMLENDMRAVVSKAELDHRHAIQTAEKRRAQQLEELDHQFEKKLYDRRPDAGK